MAIRALGLLASAQPSIFNLPPSTLADLHLTMFGRDKGDGSLQRVQAEAGKLNVSEHVTIRGAVPKSLVPQALNNADIFLNTTNYESFGVAVVEAAACGLCVISTDVGELPLLWRNGHDALLVRANDAPGMAQALKRVLSQPALAENLSKNARAKAEQFDWSIVLPRWEALLLSLSAHASP